jgi:hypothetical protein
MTNCKIRYKDLRKGNLRLQRQMIEVPLLYQWIKVQVVVRVADQVAVCSVLVALNYLVKAAVVHQ